MDREFTRVIDHAKREIKIMTFGGEELHLLWAPLETAARRGVSIRLLLCVELDDPVVLDKCTRIYQAFRDIAEIRHLDPSRYPEHQEQVKQNVAGWMIADSAVELVWYSRQLN